MLLLLGSLMRQRARSAAPPGWLASVTAAAGDVVPAWAASFLNQQYALDGAAAAASSLFTTARVSAASYFDAAGTAQTAAPDTPRIGALYAGGPIGLLSEQSRVNLLLNSNTLATQSVTTTAQYYTLSFWGTGSVTLSGTASATVTGTGDTVRTVYTFAATAGSLLLTVSGAVSNAQCEASFSGATASSYIQTGANTATRANEVHRWAPGALPFYNATEGTFLLRGFARNNGTSGNFLGVGDGTSANRILINQGATGTMQVVTSSTGGASAAGSCPGPTYSAEAQMTCAAAVATNSMAVSFNGGAAIVDNVVDMPVGVNAVYIGASSTGGSQCMEVISDLYYWPSRRPNAALVALAGLPLS